MARFGTWFSTKFERGFRSVPAEWLVITGSLPQCGKIVEWWLMLPGQSDAEAVVNGFRLLIMG